MATSFNDIPKVTENKIVLDELKSRIEQVRNDDIKEVPADKNYFVGIYDIDESLGHFITSVISPQVMENNEKINVPVMYGSPERWFSMKELGFLRDGKSKIILPLIMYRRTSIAQDESIIFPRMDSLEYNVQRKWDKNNRYSRFNILNPTEKKRDVQIVYSLPNYVTLSYECIIWTAFIEQLNSVVESFIYYKNSYWGDNDRFKFLTDIDSIDTAVDLATDTERMVRATFSMTMRGYILPENVGAKSTHKNTIAINNIKFTEKIG